MTRLLDDEPERIDESNARPLFTVGISAAGIAALVALGVKFGWFAALGASPPVSINTLHDDLAAHHASVVRQAEIEERSLARIVRLLELNCIQGAKTAYDRDACLRP